MNDEQIDRLLSLLERNAVAMEVIAHQNAIIIQAITTDDSESQERAGPDTLHTMDDA